MSLTQNIQSLSQQVAAIEEQFATYKQKAELLTKYEEQFDINSLIHAANITVRNYLESYERRENLSIEAVYTDAGIDVNSRAFRDTVLWINMRWSKRNRPDEDKEEYFLLEVSHTYPHNAFPEMDVHERNKLGSQMYKDALSAYQRYAKEIDEQNAEYEEYFRNFHNL
jgi:hypothetical protein